jgi:hypothetical protein
MTHKHEEKSSKKLPFGGIVLSECQCGARMRSDGKPISGMVNDGSGWFVSESKINSEEKARLQALRMLQNEGHGDEFDARDFLDSHHPNYEE